MLSVPPDTRAASKKHPHKELSNSTQLKVLRKLTKSASMPTQKMASEGRLEVAPVSNRKLLKLREATVSSNK